MMWSHEIVHYLLMEYFNMLVFSVEIISSIGIPTLLLRQQLLVDDKQRLRRLISYHSTTLTPYHKIYNKTSNPKLKKITKEIIDT